jgi:hypothetical protein
MMMDIMHMLHATTHKERTMMEMMSRQPTWIVKDNWDSARVIEQPMKII